MCHDDEPFVEASRFCFVDVALLAWLSASLMIGVPSPPANEIELMGEVFW